MIWILVSSVILAATVNIPTSSASETGRKLICYFNEDSWQSFTPEDVDPTLCTHILYAFTVLNETTFKIQTVNQDVAIDNGWYRRVTALRKYGIRVSVSIGGWGDSSSSKYSTLVNSENNRAVFVTSVKEFLRKWQFDGIDIDWEYPVCPWGNCTGPASDRDGLTTLVSELRQALPQGTLISMAVAAQEKYVTVGYDVPALSKRVDWISIMAYDMYTPYRTSAHASLYSTDVNQTSVNSSVTLWLGMGGDPAKLILGLPSYGRVYTLKDPCEHGIGALVEDVDGIPGFMSYTEICSTKWTDVVFDGKGRRGPYAYKNTTWVQYDDPAFIKEKVKYLKAKSLGGAMVWVFDTDDFENKCGTGKYPIISAIKQELHSVE